MDSSTRSPTSTQQAKSTMPPDQSQTQSAPPPSPQPAPFRAAQYVRMSTEHQQYSTNNQADQILEYASADGWSAITGRRRNPFPDQTGWLAWVGRSRGPSLRRCRVHYRRPGITRGRMLDHRFINPRVRSGLLHGRNAIGLAGRGCSKKSAKEFSFCQ